MLPVQLKHQALCWKVGCFQCKFPRIFSLPWGLFELLWNSPKIFKPSNVSTSALSHPSSMKLLFTYIRILWSKYFNQSWCQLQLPRFSQSNSYWLQRCTNGNAWLRGCGLLGVTLETSHHIKQSWRKCERSNWWRSAAIFWGTYIHHATK